ncbi:peptidoglycan-binding domain-containing protein [Solimonas soli]|uniref:peptidoglycan-binding domain-containing protein n=1 Tax=Solimonas soli TaxID=413479 RepID=UPI0004B4222B|nr:peptidoglycan-binding domain-containing protein [Solimonas soli]
MTTGNDFVKAAQKHVSEKYVLGVRVPKDNASWTGPWDCAEFISWTVYQVAGKLYGCDDNGGNPAIADAYTGYWDRDSRRLLTKISIDEAAATPGALLLRSPSADLIGHIVFSDGEGGTIEAASSRLGVTNLKIAGRRWDTGLLVPDIDYRVGTIAPVTRPGLVLRVTRPTMKGTLVKDVQRALKAAGFSPGDIDGEYGPHTAEAVRAFQIARRLVADGEAGKNTFKALGL